MVPTCPRLKYFQRKQTLIQRPKQSESSLQTYRHGWSDRLLIKYLNEAESRVWTDTNGTVWVGIWECMDFTEVSRASALIFQAAHYLHLEGRKAPASLNSFI